MNYEIYIVQVIAILFTFALAKHNAVPVIHFEYFGVTSKEMAKFHRYNVWVKVCFCLIAAATGIPDKWNMAFAGVLSFLWIYLLFDPILNKSRNKSWDYLGENDADGRRWIKWCKANAGEKKAVILFALILAINAVIIIKDIL